MKKLFFVIVVFVLGVTIFLVFGSTQGTNKDPFTLNPATKREVTSPQLVGEPVSYLKAPKPFTISTIATELENPRDLELTSGGTVLVSVPSNNAIVALIPDEMGYQQKVIIEGENVVHGIAFYKNTLYVAQKNAVLRYTWDEPNKTATFVRKLTDLPGFSNHIYRTLVVGADEKLYISIGSNCNVCIEADPLVGTVITVNLDGSGKKVFAKGQRNAPFLALNPTTKAIWATGMGRDYLGDDLPPDEINILQEGDFGWPICYGNNIHDTDFDTKQYIQDPCRQAIAPIYEIPAHSAPLGLAFIPDSFQEEWAGDLLVAYHGSWNRTNKTGYKIVRMEVKNNQIIGVEDFITGFLEGNIVHARPVDLLFDQKGNLFISDDKSGNVFKVSKQQ